MSRLYLGRKREKGTAMLEGALVMLTVFSMSIFIIDMGRFLMVQEYIAERARATARQAAVNGWNATQVKNYLVYNNATTADLSASNGRMGMQTSNVTYTTMGPAGSPNHRLQVKVSGVQAFLFIPYLNGSYTLPTVVATSPAEAMGATE